MIKSIADAETEKVFRREFSQRLPVDIQSVALRKLRMLNNAHTVKTFAALLRTALRS